MTGQPLPGAELVLDSALTHLPLVHRGKVRDVYAVDADHLLIVASDRLSAFDVVLPTGIPGKGVILTAISNFWFRRTGHIIANHLQLACRTLEEALPDAAQRARLARRTVVARRLRGLPVEAIVRGYLMGSGWKDYQRTGAVCGIALPPGLRLAERLPAPIYTPSTKAAVGGHDQNIGFEDTETQLGPDLAARIRDISLRLYREAAAHALSRGIIIADTKFEFGLGDDGSLILMDEILTPDSSRFWPADGYRAGHSPPSFDKQFVRDYLESLDWNKQAPAPALPPGIQAQTAARYLEAQRRLLGNP